MDEICRDLYRLSYCTLLNNDLILILESSLLPSFVLLISHSVRREEANVVALLYLTLENRKYLLDGR